MLVLEFAYSSPGPTSVQGCFSGGRSNCFCYMQAPVYDNCRMLSREGDLLCFCDKDKANWYLDRGLAGWCHHIDLASPNRLQSSCNISTATH